MKSTITRPHLTETVRARIKEFEGTINAVECIAYHDHGYKAGRKTGLPFFRKVLKEDETFEDFRRRYYTPVPDYLLDEFDYMNISDDSDVHGRLVSDLKRLKKILNLVSSIPSGLNEFTLEENDIRILFP